MANIIEQSGLKKYHFINQNSSTLTYSDDDDLANHVTALCCKGDSVGGTVRFQTVSGDIDTEHLGAGQCLILAIKKVFDTGTTIPAGELRGEW